MAYIDVGYAERGLCILDAPNFLPIKDPFGTGFGFFGKTTFYGPGLCIGNKFGKTTSLGYLKWM